MSAVVVDTSIWVAFFRGTRLPALEEALASGLVVLAPIVAAELLSAPLTAKERTALSSFLADLPLHPTPFEHWVAVGELRARLARAGLTMSTPDAHVARCAIETAGAVWSSDAIFRTAAPRGGFRLFHP